MLEMNINSKELDLTIKEFGAQDKIIAASFRAAINRTARWLRTQATRSVSSELQIKSSIVRHRMKAMKLRRDRNGNWVTGVWFGTNPIPFSYMNPKQTKTGVKAGKYSIEHAFIAKGQVFKRTSRARLPIERQGLEVQKSVGKLFKKDLVDKWPDFFFKEFRRQLEWRTSA